MMWFARRQKAPYVRSMTLRSPHSHSSVRETALDYEIVQEQAVALGRLGRALEVALASLSDFDRARRNAARIPRRAPRFVAQRESDWCRRQVMRCGASLCSAKLAGCATRG
jgi:hypothetical protein